ncbi:Cytochrome c family protein [Citrifermentans bremense]|uniref:Cytochrome c family protein n=2 Tax=Citrifermentans bremense TaxID=60035 RepID=A0A6S6M0Y1_9BACT|nr:Cytochrome c family protein [Citrifermentans bremense]
MRLSRFLQLISVSVTVTMLYACANSASIARVHPETVTGLPNCAECHTDSWGALNHKAPDFMIKHKNYSNTKFACDTCHQEAFCSDCHAHREEIKPSSKFSNAVERNLPHRGDYLRQHKIDGKINPASCVKCHGRQNNEGCKSCHR